MKTQFRWILRILWFAFSLPGVAEERSIVPNGSMEEAGESDWPAGWGQPSKGGRWMKEENNRFLRLQTQVPGETAMIYKELRLPPDIREVEIEWRQRVTGLEIGNQKWFDARVLIEFADQNRVQLPDSPSPVTTEKDTQGWVQKRVTVKVPESAVFLRFMPALLMVKAGTMDIDDVRIIPGNAGSGKMLRGRTAAAERLRKTGNLIINGDFQSDGNQDGSADGWGAARDGRSSKNEGENRFLRLEAEVPGKIVSAYREVDLPEGLEAVSLQWKQRISNLKVGKMPWFDARILLEWRDADGRKMKSAPPPVYTQRDTGGWESRESRFLVPAKAAVLVIMPSLFQVESGRFDLDDIALNPVEAGPLKAKVREEAEAARQRHVDFERPDKKKWPAELKAIGNRLLDGSGTEVWLQGVNAGGLETLPHDQQILRSVVVATEDWNANVVRLPVKEEFWFGRNPVQKDGGLEYRERVDQAVVLAANRGAYLVLDLHRFRAPKPEHAEFWRDAAKRYANHPAVIFDLFNEPYGIDWKTWRDGGFVGNQGKLANEPAFVRSGERAENQGFRSIGMQALVNAVRETGARNLVVAGGLSWSSDLRGVTDGYALNDNGGNGIVYGWHIYNWHRGWEDLMLAASEQHPILVGELGADTRKMDFIPHEIQEEPETWVPDMLGFIQKHRLNWTGWCLHPGASPVMISDWKYTPTPWGTMAREALSGRVFELKKTR